MPEKNTSINILRHIAIIMDGNRRWAKRHFLPTLEGHRRGYNKIIDVIRWCIENNVQVLTVYAFSSENWNRTREEVDYLMNLLRMALQDEKDEFNKQGVRVKIIGQKGRFADDIQLFISQIEQKTSHNEKLLFQLALSYGGRPEIIQAIQNIAQAIEKKELSAKDVSEDIIRKNLWTKDIPDPDLIIRTGGEQRLSNFLLWQSAYSELYFTKIYWPAFSQKEFLAAIEEYYQRQRRYGK